MMSHSILDLMFSGLNETKSVGSLDLMETEGKQRRKVLMELLIATDHSPGKWHR